jgi:type IX secretion system PorP/SprF family membrane protein
VFLVNKADFAPHLSSMRKLVTAILLLAGACVRAQDPVFSQFYAIPVQLNPGFTGSAIAPRLGLAYRNQWTGFSTAYRTYAAYYEQPVERLNSGFGVRLEGDNAGNGIYKTTSLAALYAYRLYLTEHLSVRLGVEAGARQSNLNWDKLLFPDQIDDIDGFVYNTEELRPDVTNRTQLDLSSGLLLLSDRFYAGFTLRHINTPRESILLVNENLQRGLPLSYIFQAGTDLIVKKGNKVQPPSFISPNLLFIQQGPYRQLNVGAYASMGNIFCGAWFRHTFRNADAAILMAGFREGIFKLGLSYDITVSGLSNRAGGTYELTFGMLFDQNENLKKKKKRADINDCLRMFQ